MIEIVVALFICSLIFIFLLPNFVRQYATITEIEKKLQMKQILYEELLNNEGENFFVVRENYKIDVNENGASIEDMESGEKIVYD